jgi:signal transduction histidine kinase/CheY-like chemotaxis protein
MRAEHPDLVITDILMPTMDGFEFVRQVRADPIIAQTPVIFSSAHYHEREAQALAQACGVSHILVKPAEPEVVLRAVADALGLPGASAEAAATAPPESFDREHLQLVTDKLAQKMDELRMVNARLTDLIDIGYRIALEPDPLQMLTRYCHAARDLVGARFATIAMLDDEGQMLQAFFTSGMDPPVAQKMAADVPQPDRLGPRLAHSGALRLCNLAGDPADAGLPPRHPPSSSFLGVPIHTATRTYGWLGLANKLGMREFGSGDERLAAMLAAQLAVAYENARQYAQLQRHAEELETARAQAEAANRLKDAFLAIGAHELRTPLTSLIGRLYLAKQRARPRVPQDTSASDQARRLDEIHALLARCQSSTARLTRLTDDLTNVAHIQQGRFDMQMAPCDLTVVVRECVEEYTQLHPDRTVRLEIFCQNPLTAEVDADRLAQVITNFLSNADKYTPRGQPIHVSVRAEGTHARIGVRDHGPGLPAEQQERIWERYHRVPGIQENSSEIGLGLGLYLARTIVEQHGGQVGVDSTPGRGSTFWFRLPLAARAELTSAYSNPRNH